MRTNANTKNTGLLKTNLVVGEINNYKTDDILQLFFKRNINSQFSKCTAQGPTISSVRRPILLTINTSLTAVEFT